MAETNGVNPRGVPARVSALPFEISQGQAENSLVRRA